MRHEMEKYNRGKSIRVHIYHKNRKTTISPKKRRTESMEQYKLRCIGTAINLMKRWEEEDGNQKPPKHNS